MQPTPKKLYLVSLGCAKAQVDAEAGLAGAQRAGYEIVDQPEGADLVVVNTCSFIQPAIEESLNTVLELGELRQDGRIGELVVAGCLVDRYGDALAEELPEADRFLPSTSFQTWTDDTRHSSSIQPSPGPALPSATEGRVLLNAAHYAYVKIAEGCDRNCAFCSIPSIRGRQRSRPVDAILEELAYLAGEGVQEGVFVSQDTVRWGRDLDPKARLRDLLEAVEAMPNGPRWVRLHYLYPDNSAQAIVDHLADSRRIVPYVDVPIQHASDHVLKRMKRAHTADDSRRLIETLRDRNPDIAIRTTVIVGHPGERPEDVDALCDFLEWARFDAVGIFTYWPEEGTDAASLPDPVDESERYERAAEVDEVARQAAESAAERFVGRELEILVDGRDPYTGTWQGRHAGQAPDVDGVVRLPGFSGPAGTFIRREIAAVDGPDLVAADSTVANPLRVL